MADLGAYLQRAHNRDPVHWQADPIVDEFVAALPKPKKGK